MHAIVVYESHWGNTARIAQAIAEGLGPGATAMSTSEALPTVVQEADLVVAGAPLNAFGLPSEQIRQSIATQHTSPPPDLSHPSLRSWLDQVPAARGRFAAFETRFRWSPGSATHAIQEKFRASGYREVAGPAKFLVTGTNGPLRDGEIERARAWGASLLIAAQKDAH